MISLVTPCLNSELFLEELIASVKRDPLVEEHIIVDSFSTDRTVEIARDHRCRVLTCDPGNMYSAINLGIDCVKTEYVSYINSDDVWYGYPQKHYNGSDVVYSDIDFIDADSRFLHSFKSARPPYLKGILQRGIMPFPQAGTIFKVSLWNYLGHFSEAYKFSADFDFFLRAAFSGHSFYYAGNHIGAVFRIHGSQLSQQFEQSMKRECDDAIGSIDCGRSSFFSLAHFKGRNIGNYAIRYLRAKALGRGNKIRSLGC